MSQEGASEHQKKLHGKPEQKRDPKAGGLWDAAGILRTQLGKSSLLKDNHTEELPSIPLFLYAITLIASRQLNNSFVKWSFVTGSSFGV